MEFPGLGIIGRQEIKEVRQEKMKKDQLFEALEVPPVLWDLVMGQ
jgi:hypothetical protein